MSNAGEEQLSMFSWEGMNRSGQKVAGEIEAKSLAVAKAELLKQGILTKKIRKQTQSIFSKRNKKITQGDITLFSRQMATMINAGIPIIKAFDIVAQGLQNEKLTRLVMGLKKDVEGGTNFATALRKEPKYFNDLFCNLVEAGEQSGSLDVMLDNIATYKEKIESIKAKIKKALFYPTAVLVVAFLVTAALLIFVVPQFESLFKGFGADLPALTRLVVELSEIFQAYWWIIFGCIGAIIWLLFQVHRRSPEFAFWLDKMSLKIPIIGPVLKKSAIARFARTLSITFAAGLPLVEALNSVGGATGNRLYAEATGKIREEVSTGQQMHIAMRHTKLFPQMVIQMVAIGEESGALEEMLAKSADFFEEEVDNIVDGLSSLLEPIIMAVLGILVGGLVIAMYLPIFKIGSVV